VRVPHLSPTTLTADEERLILRATVANVRDHTITSLALGTGLHVAEIVGLNAGDLFLLDAVAPKLLKFWTYNHRSAPSLELSSTSGYSRPR
jgi:site-specific recombinase XerC